MCQCYFPALLHKVFVLRPSSFLQKAFADVGLKFLSEHFRTKVLRERVKEILFHYNRVLFKIIVFLYKMIIFIHQKGRKTHKNNS